MMYLNQQKPNAGADGRRKINGVIDFCCASPRKTHDVLHTSFF